MRRHGQGVVWACVRVCGYRKGCVGALRFSHPCRSRRRQKSADPYGKSNRPPKCLSWRPVVWPLIVPINQNVLAKTPRPAAKHNRIQCCFMSITLLTYLHAMAILKGLLGSGQRPMLKTYSGGLSRLATQLELLEKI